MLAMTKPAATSLIDRLPPVRGRYRGLDVLSFPPPVAPPVTPPVAIPVVLPGSLPVT